MGESRERDGPSHSGEEVRGEASLVSCDLEVLSCDSALFWRLEELRVGLIWVGHRESCSSILGGGGGRPKYSGGPGGGKFHPLAY